MNAVEAARKPLFNITKKLIPRKAETIKVLPIRNYESIEDATGLIPEVIADVVVREEIILRLNLTNRLKDGPKLTQWLVDYLIKVYDNNEDFKKKLKGSNGREYAYSFMRHWASSYIKKNWSEAEFKKLGPNFHNGIEVKPIPRKAEIIESPPVKAPPAKRVAPSPKPKSKEPTLNQEGEKILKYWKGGDSKNTYEIELVERNKGHSINTYTSNYINPKARSKSSEFISKLTEAQAIEQYNKYVKLITTAKGLTVKKSIVKVKAQESPIMNVEAKLAVFAKKTGKKKRTSQQIMKHLTNGGKKLLKMEEKLKAKKAVIDKELEKLKGIKTKHKARMIDHKNKMKAKEVKQIANIGSKEKFPKNDLAVAVKKVKK